MGSTGTGDETVNDTKKISDLISYLKRHAGAYVLPGWDGHNLAKLAEAALAANVPAGYKLVPVEPTPEMRKAFHCANAEAEEGTPLGSPDIDSPDHQWAAMLAAAPAPEAERAHPFGRCMITGPGEDVAFIFRHLPDVDDTEPAQKADSRPDSLRCAGCDIDNGCPEYCKCGQPPAPAPEAEPDSEAVTACWQDFGRTEEFRRAVKWSQDGEIPGALFVAFRAGLRAASPKGPAQAQQPSEPMTNIESPFNACQHREHCKGWKMVATDVVGRAKPEAQQPEYRLLVKGDVFKDGDECLLDDCKRWAPITPIFRGHPHMPGFHVPHRRPEAGIGASGEAL